MQPIGENSYLNENLVTCAEYQVFVNAMRGQDKYHQPDHWNAYKFPEGEADEPVLGVRPSDAVAYCTWLTGGEKDGWKYRLPTRREADRSPLGTSTEKLLGYWVSGGEGHMQFSWSGPVPENARRIGLFRAFTTAIERSTASILEQERARNRALDLFRIFDLEQSLNRPLDLDRDLALARFQAREHASVLQLDHAPTLAMDVDQAIDRDLDRALDLTRALDRSGKRAKAISHAREHALRQALAPERPIDRTIVVDLVIYIDLFTLQERIAGRSPAFEGIRIVRAKE